MYFVDYIDDNCMACEEFSNIAKALVFAAKLALNGYIVVAVQREISQPKAQKIVDLYR